MDHSGSTFSMLVLAVWPPTTKPVMPLSSGGTLVAKVVKTFGQLGSAMVLSLPKVPLSRTFLRFGIWPWISKGRRMSHSAPFTAKTMTFGCDGLASVADLVSSAKASGEATKSVTRATLRRFSIRPLLHESKSSCLENYNSCERRCRAIAVVRRKEKRPPAGGLSLNDERRTYCTGMTGGFTFADEPGAKVVNWILPLLVPVPVPCACDDSTCRK